MRILAIESALLGGSVALLHGDRLLAESQLESQRRTAQTLAPAIHGLLEQARWQPNEVQLVAVTQGPGSFTGLRIGVTTAKAFAYATGAEILGVDTLRVLAHQIDPARRPLWAILDAERGQLFAARFRAGPHGWLEDAPADLFLADTWLSQLSSDAIVTGPPLTALRPRLPPSVHLAPEFEWVPRASTVGQLAWRLYAGGERADMWSLLPTYFRPSAAEEKSAGGAQKDGKDQKVT
jgi:tRNA threonylcarbamoyladenosine biosynthesis protein TsaB